MGPPCETSSASSNLPLSDPAPQWSIRRRTGEVVTVDVSRVIAAKVVPDAPLRLRSASDIDATTLEKIAAEAWQPLERESLGGWVLRAARGFTGRANSVLPLGSPGVPLDEALSTVAHWYRTRALPPTIQVPLPLRSDLDAALERRRLAGPSGRRRDGRRRRRSHHDHSHFQPTSRWHNAAHHRHSCSTVARRLQVRHQLPAARGHPHRDEGEAATLRVT